MQVATKSFNDCLYDTYCLCARDYVNLVSSGNTDFSYFSRANIPREIMVSLYRMAVAKKLLVPITGIPEHEKLEIYNDAKQYWPGADTNNLIRMSLCIYTMLWFCETQIN